MTTLISHSLNKVLKLKDHIDQVIIASKYIISQKTFNFTGITKVDLEKISILIAACHDFGKSTLFFQDYIQCKINNKKYSGNDKDKSHSLISGLFGWYMCEKWIIKNNQLEERWNNFIPFAVFLAIEGHHSSYSSIEEILKAVNDSTDSGLIQRQLDNIQPEIFSYEFEKIKLIDGNDFNIEKINNIKKQLRKFHREYHKELLENQIEQRILGLLLYSILLEADKAYLAPDNPNQYEREVIQIPDDIVEKYIDSLDNSSLINEERKKAYLTTINNIKKISLNERIHSITLPTGLGKTLIAASWAIKLRSTLQNPKIIVSLPFLSIIEQTDDVYKKFFGELYKIRAERLYTTRYSIADFKYRDGIDRDERSDNSIDFFLSIWNSEVIVTTFDQLFYSVFSLKSKHLMRFHNLFNSILIFDEIQALPSDLWKPFEMFFKKLSEVGNTHILLMSATQPDFFNGVKELVPNHKEYFLNRERVELIINNEKITINKFIENLLLKLDQLYDKSVMVVLNTRPSCKRVYEYVKKAIKEKKIQKRPFIFLSSYVTPAQRIKRIIRINRLIKGHKKPIIITTQCIEAGVDIDVDYIIRDWAPLDSIFQVCGRCNRNGKNQLGTVEVVNLISENNINFSKQVYDEILLNCTAVTLNNSNKIYEKQFYDFGYSYFNEVKKSLGHSMKLVEAFAKYIHKYNRNGKEVDVNIKKILREEELQEHFIVSSFDIKLIEDIKNALAIEDRWRRRFVIKRLSKRIAENSISIRFEKWMPNTPDEFTEDSIGNFRILYNKFYDKRGVGFNADIYKPIGGVIIV